MNQAPIYKQVSFEGDPLSAGSPTIDVDLDAKKCRMNACKWALPVLIVLALILLTLLIVKMINNRSEKDSDDDEKTPNCDNPAAPSSAPSPSQPQPQSQGQPMLLRVPSFPVHGPAGPDVSDGPMGQANRMGPGPNGPPEAYTRTGQYSAFRGASDSNHPGDNFQPPAAYEDHRNPAYDAKVPHPNRPEYPDPHRNHDRSFADSQDNSVQEVTGEQVSTYVYNLKKPAVVMFHAKWCGHCKNTMPNFQKAAAMSKIPFLCVEHSVSEEKLAKKLGITGYPTIMRFQQGEMISEYQGNRTAEDIAKFANQ